MDIDGIDDRFPPIRSLDTARGNLPRLPTTFVGRERELGAVLELLDGRRLVTLTGPGGTGKTRLALEAARAALDRFDDGAWFVDLAPIRDPALVPLAIARALEVVVDPGGDALQAATRHLEHRRALVILDNFEQVLDARVAVASLLETTERTAFLVTSREPLGTYGEQELPVPPFSEADSVALFVERARAIRPDFSLTERSASTVGRIVDHVGGLPLAVELAATQVRVLSPSSLLKRLEEHLPVPSVPDGGRPERQRTMDRAIAWSYDLLEDSERRMFARLSTLPGGSSLPAAEAFAEAGDGSATVLDGLAALVRKSLLRQEDTADDEPRFRMLEPILEFATDQLSERGDSDNAHRRIANYWLAFAQEAEGHLTGHEQATWLDRCELEGPNLREALDWALGAGEIDLGLEIASRLWRFWHQRGPIQEGRDILDRLLALDGGSPAVRGRANGAAGGLAWWGGDFAATGRHYAAALALLEGSGDVPGEAEALYNAGFALLWQAVLNEGMDADRAEDLFRRALGVAESIDDCAGRARALRGLGFVSGVARGDPAAALPLFKQSVALAEQAGDRWEMNESIIGVGNAYRFSGEKGAAKREYLRGIDLMVEAGNRPVVIGLVLLLSALEAEMGRHDRVSRLWGAAQSQREASGAISPPASIRIIGDPVAEARAGHRR